MEKICRITVPIYYYGVRLILTDNINSSRISRECYMNDDDKWVYSPYVDGMHSYNDKDNFCWIFVSPECTDGVLLHEVYHAVSRMFRFYGCGTVDEETFAYTLQWLFEACQEKKKIKSRFFQKKVVSLQHDTQNNK